MTDNSPALKSRYTLFFDFLGTAHAAQSWSREQVHAFIDLLISVAEVQSAESISGSPEPDGGYRFQVTPEITTFSDNVVVSYPGVRDDPEFKLIEPIWAEIACEDAIRVLAGVAEHGLRFGALIRGGLSYGQLYHQNGVVFGEAMVDAYALESKVAGVPRVVVSDRVVGQLDGIPPTSLLIQDADGLWHLNYFAKMARTGLRVEADGSISNPSWKTAHFEMIEKQIDALSQGNNPSSVGRIAKWEWFKRGLEKAIAELEIDTAQPGGQ